MEDQSKPLMRSLMYLHVNQATRGNRAPIIPYKQPFKHSLWLTAVLLVVIAYLLAALFITNGF